MARDLTKTYLYHITDVTNLECIIARSGLLSDIAISQVGGPTLMIGHANIKLRRMTQYRVPCVANRLVGEFVPFYYCPRSPMLYTMNRGTTGLPPGGQINVVHLVTTVAAALKVGHPWAISDSNAGSNYAQFFDDIAKLDTLNWDAINAHTWHTVTSAKQAEFLVADHFPWTAIVGIGCHNAVTHARVDTILASADHKPKVLTKPAWYYG